MCAVVGHKVSEETRRKISQKLKGNIPWNKGLKGWFPHDNHGFKKGMEPWNKGVKVQLNTGRTHFKKGQRSPNWKGGISRLQSRVYANSKTKFWREEVFRRDNWTCQICGRQGDLEAHHIIPVNITLNRVLIDGINEEERLQLALALPELFNPDNGITLCKQCHYSKHNKRIKFKENKNEKF